MNIKIFILFFLLLLLTQNCYAYLDMGSGSFIIQLIMGFLFGTIVLLKVYWQKFIEYIKKIFKRK